MADDGDLEAKFIANGKAYGYDGEDLRKYVEARLHDAMSREERSSQRDKVKLEEKIRELEDTIIE